MALEATASSITMSIPEHEEITEASIQQWPDFYDGSSCGQQHSTWWLWCSQALAAEASQWLAMAEKVLWWDCHPQHEAKSWGSASKQFWTLWAPCSGAQLYREISIVYDTFCRINVFSRRTRAETICETGTCSPSFFITGHFIPLTDSAIFGLCQMMEHSPKM